MSVAGAECRERFAVEAKTTEKEDEGALSGQENV